MNRHPTHAESRYRHTEGILFQEVNGEIVLLNLEAESYFGLNRVGSRIWELLGQQLTLAEVFAILIAEFQVEPAQLEADVQALLNELLKAGLIKAI